MTKNEFLELYETHTINELCEKMDCSQATIYRMLKKYDLPLKQGRIEITKRKSKFELK